MTTPATDLDPLPPPRCSRLALLLSPEGRTKKFPIPDDMELRESYQFGGVPYRVVLVTHETTIDDLRARLTARAEALNA